MKASESRLGLVKILVSSGERSGDQLLLKHVSYLSNEGFTCVGMGGEALADVGLQRRVDPADIAVTGLTEALPALLPTLRALRTLKDELITAQGALLSDFPEVNLRLIEEGAKRGVPTAYIAPPQAWAWRPWRVKRLRKASLVGCLFPFSQRWFSERGVNAHWIGHPLATSSPPKMKLRGAVCLMPGSRPSTVRQILPSMVALVQRLQRMLPDQRFLCARSPHVPLELFQAVLGESGVAIEVCTDVEHALTCSQLVIAHPGTATLHATLRGCTVLSLCNPSATTKWVARRLLRVKSVVLPNILLDRRVFPEFLVSESAVDEWADQAYRMLTAPEVDDDDFCEIWNQCFCPEGAKGFQQELNRLFT